MTLLLLTSGCLYRGPWGLWALHGEGEITPLGPEEVPVVVDGQGRVYTASEVSAALADFEPTFEPPWHDRVVIDGEALFMTLDPDTDVATFRRIDGTIHSQAEDAGSGEPYDSADLVDDVRRGVGLGTATDGGGVMISRLDLGESLSYVVHRESGGTWSRSVLSTAPAGSYSVEPRVVAAHGALVAFADEDHAYQTSAEGLLEEIETSSFVDDLRYAADGSLVLLGRAGDRTLEISRPGCSNVLEFEAAVLLDDGAEVAVLGMTARGGLVRRPVGADCSLEESTLEWIEGVQGDTDSSPEVSGDTSMPRPDGDQDYGRPILDGWGDSAAAFVVFDVDPAYDHPDPVSSSWDVVIQQGAYDTYRY